MLTISGVTDAQCTDGVELMVDGKLIFNGTTLSRPVNDSFVVSCRKCGSGSVPKWFYSDENDIQTSCDDTGICSARNNNFREFRVSSFTESLAGTYKCTTTQNGTITINVLG